MQNKRPLNEQGQNHGLWIQYHKNGEIFFKGNCINGQKYGYWEYNFSDNKLYKQYHAK